MLKTIDIFSVSLTSRIAPLLEGEFVLSEWSAASLNVKIAVKRGLYTVQESLVLKTIGQLRDTDAEQLDRSLRGWLGL